jgi:hypothetical protein
MQMNLPAPVRALTLRHDHPSAAMVVTPHPLTLEGQRVLDAHAAPFTPGETLAALLERHGVLPGQQWVVCIGGIDVPEQHWHRVRPKHGHLIEARRVPNKDILRIAAIAALSYFTFGAGGLGGAGGFLGLGTGIGAKLLAGVAFLAGSAIINKLLAPKPRARSENSDSPTYSLTGGRNRPRPYESMALVLGEPYAVPDIGAQPYTYFANGEQYLWQIFHLGLNCADVSNLRVGQTSLSAYQGVTTLRNGLASGNTDFPALGTSVDTVAGALLTYNVYTTRTSSVGTVRLALDFVASLFATNNDGAFIPFELNLSAQYRAVGDVDWIGFTPGLDSVAAVVEFVSEAINDGSGAIVDYYKVISPAVEGYPAGTIRVRHASQKPLRFTVELAVPPDQYEVRILKATADYTGGDGSNSVEWTQLRSYQEDTASYDGQARLAVQIQASGQLNGALDELNVQLRAASMDYWNGSAWVTATDRASGLCNPGALFLLLARGGFDGDGRRQFGLGYSDSQIDIEGLKRFMVHCADKGFEFDLFHQDNTSIDELLEKVAYAGMGEKAWPDGKIGVTFFTRDDPIEGVINMANIKARSFEVSYDTLPTADEIEFQYFDRERGNTWKPIRVKAPGVDVPRSTVGVQLVGITTEAHAATMARFAMAQNIYQRKTVTCEMDLEYMTYRRGSVVSLSHDLTQWGYSGRLQAFQDTAGVITLTLDEPAQGTIPSGGAGRYIGLRLPGETQVRVFPVQSFSGESRTVVLDAPWPGGVDQPGADADNPARDTLWVYDFQAVPGQRLRVVSIEPSANGARLALVPETEEFWDFTETGVYQPPPNNSLLRDAPEVVRLLVSEQLARQGNTYYTELSANFEATGPFKRAELWGAVGTGEIAPPQRLLDSGDSQTLNWQGGLDERWHLELRLYSDTRASVPYRLYFDVQGLRAPPPDVTDLVINGEIASWTPVDVPDLAGYLIRFQYGDNAWWDTAVPLHTGVITESPYNLTRRPQGDVTVLIKAIDTTGNESVNAAAYRYGFSEIVVKNPVVTLDQHPTFPGDITGGTVSGGDLEADDLDEFYEPALGPMYLPEADPMYGTSQYGEMVYEFGVASTEAGILVLQYSIAAETLLIEYQTGGSDPMYEPSADPMYEPTDEAIYGEFGEWAIWPGSLDFDGASEVRFRLTLSAGLSQGVIYELTALIDAPEISEVVDDAAIGSGGTRLTLTNTYRVIRSVQLTVQSDGGSGVTPRVIDKNPTLGPLVEILNSSGTAVAGLLDAEIRGY